MRQKISSKRIIIGSIALLGLLAVYLFQRSNFYQLLSLDFLQWSKQGIWMFNRSVRFVLNDIFAILLVYTIFGKKQYVWFAFAVQVFGILFILSPYLIIKWHFPHYNGPLINFLHRLILNPFLVIILIPAFYLKEKGENVSN